MKYISLIFYSVLMAMTIGCQEPDYGKPQLTTDINYAKVLYINASPGTTLPFLLNNAEAASLTFPAASSYVNTVANSEQFRLKNTIYGVVGADTVFQAADLVSQSTLTVATSYTLFVTDTTKRPFGKANAFGTNKGGLQFLGPITDVLTPPAAGNTGVRFLNVAPGAPAVFLTAGGNSLNSLSSSRAYRTTTNFTSFTAITAGNYSLEVRTGSATGPIIASLPPTALADGKLYTVYLSGMKVGNLVKVPYAINIVQHN